MRLFDAHNHLHDKRLALSPDELIAECVSSGVVAAVVNGTAEDDWDEVLSLAQRNPVVVPSFGLHPWRFPSRSPEWLDSLVRNLRSIPSGVGEIGIDRWKTDLDPKEQESVFMAQVEIAQQESRPMSIHGLRAWGRLHELLRGVRIPQCGFLLHSYGGPPEMVPQFASLGAYFSFPGSFLNPGREMKIAAFAAVPAERLLLETDAPDQCLPPAMDRYALTSPQDGKRTNHPANIRAVYEGYAESQGLELSALSAQLERNFRALFGALLRA
jgi:TatD DNase family protein